MPHDSLAERAIRLEHGQVFELAVAQNVAVDAAEERPRRANVVGLVVQLTRGEHLDESSVVVRAEVEGRIRKLHANLTSDDHQLAIRAYEEELPLSITGDLVRERRSWWLVGNLELGISRENRLDH